SSLCRSRKSLRSCSSDAAGVARRRTCCKSDPTAFASMERPPEHPAFGITPYTVRPPRRGAQLFLMGVRKVGGRPGSACRPKASPNVLPMTLPRPAGGLVGLVPDDDGLGREPDELQAVLVGEDVVEAPVPVRLVGAEVLAEDRAGHGAVERQDFRPAAHADVMAEPCSRVPVDNADGAPRVALQVGREGRAADDPDGLPIPVEPNGGLTRATLGVMGQVGIQWP